MPFDALAPQKFEELCLWLVRREGYERLEYFGEAGNEQGRDIVAWKDGQRVVFQSKRVAVFCLATAKKEIAKLRALPFEDQPAVIVFVTPKAVSAELRERVRSVWGEQQTCHFWSGGELDELVKQHPDIVLEFFQVKVGGLSWRLVILGIGILASIVAWYWLLARGGTVSAVARISIEARDIDERLLPGCQFSYSGVESLATNHAGTTELKLPSSHSPGQQIKLHLLAGCAKGQEWFLVNDMVNVPASKVPAEVVIMRRSELRNMAAEIRDTSSTVDSDQNDPAASRRVLTDVAKGHGLTVGQIETAIKSFAETSANSIDHGIAAYLEGQFGTAEILLAEAAEKKEDDLVEIMRFLGASQYEQAKFQLALRSFEKALALDGQDSSLLNWVSKCLYELARWQEAEPLMRQSIVLAEAGFGNEHSKVATSLNNLAQLFQATNRLAEAEPLMRRALAIDEKNFGKEHPNVARDLNNLARLLQATNRLGEAEPLMRRALAIDEASFGEEHPNVANRLNNLSVLLLDTNRLAEAEPLMRRALAIAEANFGKDHPTVATDLNNLALLLKATNRLAEAERLMRRALAIDEVVFGKDHPDVAIDLNNLARLLQANGRLAEAEVLIRRSVKILIDFTQTSRHEHPSLIKIIANHERIMREMDWSESAISATKRELGWPPK